MSLITNKIQVSGKVGDGIFVVAGDTPEEFASNCTMILGAEGFQDVKAMFGMALIGGKPQAAVTAQAVSNFQAAAMSSPAPSDQAPWDAAPATTPAPQQAPQGNTWSESDNFGNVYTYGIPGAPQCPHGPRAQKKGISKAGKAYTAWVCDTQTEKAYKAKVTKSDCAIEWAR